jgi:hypothetical protein
MVNLPDRAVCRVIRYYSLRVPDPLERLKFLRYCTAIAQRNRYLALRRPFRSWVYRLMFLDSLANTPQVRKQTLRVRDRACLWLFRRRNEVVRFKRLAIATVVLSFLALAANTVWRRPKDEPPREPEVSRQAAPPAQRQDRHSSASLEGEEIWLVESEREADLYSNGLKVINARLAHTSRRFFPVFLESPNGVFEQIEWRDQPVGLVFHTTESDPAPLEKTNNQRIRYEGQQLLSYIQRNRLYNFTVDRFGRVFRIVPEEEYAHHAGNSLWASDGELYVNLNQSFLGVALEAAISAPPVDMETKNSVTPAQLVGARLLSEMLCYRFGIDSGNVVTHEMVSVNPETMRIGYHTDWKGLFPFDALNLPDNYQLPLPSLALWGFVYDAQLVKDLGGRVWPGLRLSETVARREADARALSIEHYRAARAEQYHQILSRLVRLRPPVRNPAASDSGQILEPRRAAPSTGG